MLARTERDRPFLPPDLVASLLTGAITAPVAPFDNTWRTTNFSAAGDGFPAWEQIILSQIADLRDFAEAAPQPFPNMGVDAPRRPGDGTRANDLRWFNHTVPGYLECAMAGTLGGWEPADGIRSELPGPTLALFPEPKGVVDLPPLAWEVLTGFLICGQVYE